MNERDYLVLAKKKSDEEIMNEYWTEVARRKIWISKDGTETPFKELEIGHILNIVNGLMEFENPHCKLVIKAIIQELIVRIKRKTPSRVVEALDHLSNMFQVALEKCDTLDIKQKNILEEGFTNYSNIIREEFIGR